MKIQKDNKKITSDKKITRMKLYILLSIGDLSCQDKSRYSVE